MEGPPAAQTQRPSGSEAAMAPRPVAVDPRHVGSGKLAGKVALVTGGDSGIGRAVAAAFAREGADVAICYLSHHEDAQETVRLVAREGRRALALAGDASQPDFAPDAVAKTLRAFGRLDVLVNHLGIQTLRNSLRDISAFQLHETFATNVFSMCTRRARDDALLACVRTR
jgi:NAD(P)-dependent dehydrogenase (short-subunit alcohol dehydrogenase family)